MKKLQETEKESSLKIAIRQLQITKPNDNSKLVIYYLAITLGMIGTYYYCVFHPIDATFQGSFRYYGPEPQLCSESQLNHNLYVDRFRFDLHVYVSADNLAPHPSELIWTEQNLTYSLTSPTLKFNSNITIPEVSCIRSHERVSHEIVGYA